MPGYGVFPGAKTSAIFVNVFLFAHLRLIHSYTHINITFGKCTHTHARTSTIILIRSATLISISTHTQTVFAICIFPTTVSMKRFLFRCYL